jgi:hypothetical protein
MADKIIPAGDRIVEGEMALAIEAACRTWSYGEGQMQKLIFYLPTIFIVLTPRDLERQGPREEAKWVAVLRNVGRTIKKDATAFGGRLLYLPGGIFAVREIAEARSSRRSERDQGGVVPH